MRSLGFDQVEYEGENITDPSCLYKLSGPLTRWTATTDSCQSDISHRCVKFMYMCTFSLYLSSAEHVHKTLLGHNTKLKSDLGNVGKVCVIIFCLCPGFDAISLQETSGV